MKVGIIGFSNLCLMPYLYTYTDYLQNRNIEFDVIYWDRKDLHEKSNFNSYAYHAKIKNTAPKIAKVNNLLGYMRFIKSKIKSGDYDLMIIMTSLPAVLLNPILCKHYSNRYLVDVRDYTYEHIFIYQKLFKKVLSHSALNVISSPGFREFLPFKQAVLCHNLSFKKEGNQLIRKSLPRKTNPIKISYIGFITYYEQCLNMINVLANDHRFEFHFYGMGEYNQAIQEYCANRMIRNVFLHGPYKPEEKEEIYRNTDIIFNVYGKGSNLRYALSNKFYESAWYCIPILVSEGTDMHYRSQSLSFPVKEFRLGLADEIYQWYDTMDWEKLDYDAKMIIDEAFLDNEAFHHALNNLFDEDTDGNTK